MPEAHMYQREGIESVHAPKSYLLGIERPPLDDTPDGLEFEEPESDDGQEDESGEEWKAEDVGAYTAGLYQTGWEREVQPGCSYLGGCHPEKMDCCQGGGSWAGLC